MSERTLSDAVKADPSSFTCRCGRRGYAAVARHPLYSHCTGCGAEFDEAMVDAPRREQVTASPPVITAEHWWSGTRCTACGADAADMDGGAEQECRPEQNRNGAPQHEAETASDLH